MPSEMLTSVCKMLDTIHRQHSITLRRLATVEGLLEEAEGGAE
jgi:hypothetical protein